MTDVEYQAVPLGNRPLIEELRANKIEQAVRLGAGRFKVFQQICWT